MAMSHKFLPIKLQRGQARQPKLYGTEAAVNSYRSRL